MALIVSFPDNIGVSSGQLNRFNRSIIDPECLLKISATFFCLMTFYPFQATLYFLVYYYFCLRSGITINTNVLKLMQFSLFIQISQQALLSLNLDNVVMSF